jgi:hypothetical protein
VHHVIARRLARFRRPPTSLVIPIRVRGRTALVVVPSTLFPPPQAHQSLLIPCVRVSASVLYNRLCHCPSPLHTESSVPVPPSTLPNTAADRRHRLANTLRHRITFVSRSSSPPLLYAPARNNLVAACSPACCNCTVLLVHPPPSPAANYRVLQRRRRTTIDVLTSRFAKQRHQDGTRNINMLLRHSRVMLS